MEHFRQKSKYQLKTELKKKYWQYEKTIFLSTSLAKQTLAISQDRDQVSLVGGSVCKGLAV